MNLKLCLPYVVALMALAAAGCGEKMIGGRVSGTVRLDGRPMENLVVTFLPDPEKGTFGQPATASTDDGGRYRVECKTKGEGDTLGWYRVVVEDLAPYAASRKENAPVAAAAIPSRIPAVYESRARTPIIVQLKAGEQVIDVELKGRG